MYKINENSTKVGYVYASIIIIKTHNSDMDMLNFHKYTTGECFIPEYGCSNEKEHFDNLYKLVKFKWEVWIILKTFEIVFRCYQVL